MGVPQYKGFRNKAIRAVAKEVGTSVVVTSKVVDSQFQYVKSIMESGTFQTVRLPYLGKFEVNQKRLQSLQKNDRRAQRLNNKK